MTGLLGASVLCIDRRRVMDILIKIGDLVLHLGRSSIDSYFHVPETQRRPWLEEPAFEYFFTCISIGTWI